MTDISSGTFIPEIPRPTSSSDLGVVKTPTRDVLNISSLVPKQDPKKIERAFFEQFSAIELSNVLRHDTVEGINQKYLIISNLSEVRRRYEASKQLSIMDKLSPLTSIFSIDLESKIPQQKYLQDNGLNQTYSYLDELNNLKTVEKGYFYINSNGDLIIELDNLDPSDIIQVQIDTNGTIYEVDNDNN